MFSDARQQNCLHVWCGSLGWVLAWHQFEGGQKRHFYRKLSANHGYSYHADGKIDGITMLDVVFNT